MKHKTIVVDGYWIDNNEPFSGMVVALGEWDGVEDAEDERIFYYLDGEEPIGAHDDFFITKVVYEQQPDS